jgi:hypothetical protein
VELEFRPRKPKHKPHLLEGFSLLENLSRISGIRDMSMSGWCGVLFCRTFNRRGGGMRIIIYGSCIVVNGEGISKLINRGSILSAKIFVTRIRKRLEEVSVRRWSAENGWKTWMGLRWSFLASDIIHVLKSWIDAIEIR